MGLNAISMQFLDLKGYDFEDLLCFGETVFHSERVIGMKNCLIQETSRLV